MVGLSVRPPGVGLEFRKTSPRRDVENGVPVLIVEGEVANISNTAVDVPKLKVILSDHNGNEVQSWTFSVAEPRLSRGRASRSGPASSGRAIPLRTSSWRSTRAIDRRAASWPRRE